MFFHEVAAYYCWATRHSTLAVHQHIFISIQVFFNKIVGRLIVPFQLRLLAVFTIDKQMILGEPEIIYCFTDFQLFV